MVTSSVTCLHACRNVGRGVLRHVCHLRHWDTETGGWGVGDYCRLPSIFWLCFDPKLSCDTNCFFLINGARQTQAWLTKGHPATSLSPPLQSLRATARARRTDNTSARAPHQHGCRVQLCDCLLVWAFLQSISQLIELLSITKGFLSSQRTPFHGSEEGYAPDSLCN